MTMPTPVCATIDDPEKPHSMRRRFLWLLPLVSGFLLSLGLPNELAPGRLGDHPPFFIAWLALLPFFWIVLTLPARQARWAGWLYGFAFCFGVSAWMRLFGYLPWVLLAFAVSLLFPLAIWMTQRMALPRWLTPLGLALTWTGLEWLRSQGIFGFSWGEFGVTQVDGFPGRMASLGSVYLITFLLLWVSGTVMYHLLYRDAPRWLLPVTITTFCMLALGGWWQSAHASHRWQAHNSGQLFALVQPNTLRGLTPQALVTSLDYEELMRRQNTLVNLSRESVADHSVLDPQRPLIIWPESALSYPPSYVGDIQELSLQTNSYLLIGAPSNGPRNSAYLLAPGGRELTRYDKIHLVPFGEFVPMRPLVQRYYTVRANDIIPGTAWTPMDVGGRRLGVGICYESNYSFIARTYANQGAQYLVYITNDAWFHQTSAVRQHFNHARFRALETGLPVARVASTGISGFIAPDGHIISEIPTYTTGARTMQLAPGLPGTVYTRVGWLFAPGCLLASFLLLCRGLMSLRHSSRNRTSLP